MTKNLYGRYSANGFMLRILLFSGEQKKITVWSDSWPLIADGGTLSQTRPLIKPELAEVAEPRFCTCQNMKTRLYN